MSTVAAWLNMWVHRGQVTGQKQQKLRSCSIRQLIRSRIQEYLALLSLKMSLPDLRHLPIRPWAGLGVLAGWSAAALLAGALLLHPRDA